MLNDVMVVKPRNHREHDSIRLPGLPHGRATEHSGAPSNYLRTEILPWTLPDNSVEFLLESKRVHEATMKTNRLFSALLWALLSATLAQAEHSTNTGQKVFSQQTFPTAKEAARALGAAYGSHDQKGIAEILGDKGFRLVSSGDPVTDHHEANWFRSLYKEAHEVEPQSENRAVLSLGRDGQPYPIPLVKEAGRWRFDPSEGHEDLLSRRISKSELSALNVVIAYVGAQREYNAKDWNGDGQREYAQRLASRPGKHDGLHWEKATGQRAGPLTDLVEIATQEGYRQRKEGEPSVYRGYVYKILKSQGAKAPGGSLDYLVGGRMSKGFALVAFPVRYAVSGVLTFLVNQEGIIYQKDLGPQTSEHCQAMTQFNPDRSWTKGSSN